MLFGMLEEQRGELTKDGTIMRTLIFVETKKQADFVALLLIEKNLKAPRINGDRPQNERERVIKQFREGTVHVLVGADVCQRGFDIPAQEQVIKYDMPIGTPEEATIIRHLGLHKNQIHRNLLYATPNYKS